MSQGLARRVRVNLVEDDENSIKFLRLSLLAFPHIHLAECFNSGDEFIDCLGVAPLPDITLVDLQLPGLDGIEVAKRALLLLPRLKFCAYTGSLDPETVHRALSGGFLGYLSKDDGAGEIVDGIETVHEGGVFLSRKTNNAIIALMQKLAVEQATITPQQRRIWDLTMRGMAIKEIAFELGISQSWVEKVQKKMRGLKGVETNIQAVASQVRKSTHYRDR